MKTRRISGQIGRIYLPAALVGVLFLGSGPRASSAPRTRPSLGQPTLRMGIVDDARLFQVRSDYPLLVTRVLPALSARHHLALVVSKQGLKWDHSGLSRVDVTTEALALLKALPASVGALNASQSAAASRAMAAIDALKSATALGELSYDNYNARLTNASILFDPAIRIVPAGMLRTRLTQAMQGYIQARETWQITLAVISIVDRTVDAEFEMKRRNTAEADIRGLINLEFAEKAEHEKRRQKAYEPLYDAWRKVALQVETARKLMPGAGRL